MGALALNHDGTRLIVSSSGSRRQINLLRVEDGEQLSDAAANATSQALSPDGKTIAVGTVEGGCLLLDGATGALVRRVEQFLGLGGTPVVLAFNPSGSLLLVDGQERTTRVFKLDVK